VAFDGSEGELVVGAIEAVVHCRGHRRHSREVEQERWYTDGHWTLLHRFAERWSLRNTGWDTASHLTLTVYPYQQRGTPAWRIEVALATLFGLRRMSERLLRSQPPAEPYPAVTNSDGLVAAGDSIDLTFPPPPNKGWLEVEWHSPDDSTHWASCRLPVNETPAFSPIGMKRSGHASSLWAGPRRLLSAVVSMVTWRRGR